MFAHREFFIQHGHGVEHPHAVSRLSRIVQGAFWHGKLLCWVSETTMLLALQTALHAQSQPLNRAYKLRKFKEAKAA